MYKKIDLRKNKTAVTNRVGVCTLQGQHHKYEYTLSLHCSLVTGVDAVRRGQQPPLVDDGGGAEELIHAEEGGHPRPLVRQGQVAVQDARLVAVGDHGEAAGVLDAAGWQVGFAARS